MDFITTSEVWIQIQKILKSSCCPTKHKSLDTIWYLIKTTVLHHVK